MPSVSNPDGQTTTTTDVAEPEPAPPAWEHMRVGQIWAVVEIMGHKVRAGSISDITIGGATLLQVEHPTLPDHTGVVPLHEWYGPGSVFSIRPCDRQTAQEWAENRWRSSRPAQALAELDSIADVDVIDEDDYDRDEPW